MLHEKFEKTVRKILIDKEINISKLSEMLGESQANVGQKLKRKTIRLLDAEKILNVLGYDLIIRKRD